MTLKRVLLKSKAHNNRVVSGIKTTQINQVIDAINNGASIQEISYTLRFPEVKICDLSNLEPPLSLCKGEQILKVFSHIKEDIHRSIEGTNFQVIYGDGLDTEVAICGESLEELRCFKTKYLKEVYKTFNIINPENQNLYNSKGITEYKKITNLTNENSRFYKEFVNRYKEYFKPDAYNKINILNLKEYPHEHKVWNDIEKLGDNKLFVLTAGLPLSLSYMNTTGDDNVHFVEVHRENDENLLYKKQNLSKFLFSDRTFNSGKSWVVIDKTYTGGTINLASEIIKSEFGNNTKIVRVGLYPKTYKSLEILDYVVFAGKLISTRYILENFNKENWFSELILEDNKNITMV